MSASSSSLKEDFSSVVTRLAAAASDLHALVADIKKESVGSHDDKGVSLLAVKNQSLLHYNAQVATLALQMSHGRSIAKSTCVGNVVDIRTVLEEVRPAEQRMAAELDRLVALTKASKKSSAPRARPELMTRAADVGVDDDNAPRDVETTAKSGLYVPPKVVPMHYSDQSARGTKSREDKATAERSRRAVNSSLIRELHEQFTDAPVEIVDATDVTQKRQMKRERERRTYEEANYTRVLVDERKEKRARLSQGTDTLNRLLDYGDYGMNEDARSARKKTTRPTSKKAGKFGKKGKKTAGKRKKR